METLRGYAAGQVRVEFDLWEELREDSIDANIGFLRRSAVTLDLHFLERRGFGT